MARTPQVEKIKLKKKIKESFRRGESLLCFAVDYGEEFGIAGVFYPKMSSRARKVEIAKVLILNKYSLRNYQVSVAPTLKEFDFVSTVGYAMWRPSKVLAALLDTTQFKRGRGGKGINAIVNALGVKKDSPKYADKVREVQSDLQILIDMGLVVRSIAFTYWPKEWFRENMRNQGISFLPTL